MRVPLLILMLASSSPVLGAERRTDVVRAVERATPAVVTIAVELPAQGGFFWYAPTGNDVSEGSGVIIDEEGVVLTNAHVVQNAVSIRVHTETRGSFDARVMALETDLDLAVLQLEDAENLPTIDIGDSDGLLLGEPAIAIGNPFALGLTVSKGIVSSTAREVEVERGLYQTYVQTDAAINPGNSGGALIDINGDLIGINTMIRSGGEGIGWAIPVNRAMKVAGDMLSYGEVRLPWLGCDFRDVSRRPWGQARDESGGILVQYVHPESPCAVTGIRAGDVLTQVGERPAVTRGDLMAHLAEKEPGVSLEVSWYRQGTGAQKATMTTNTLPPDAAQRSLKDVLGVDLVPTAQGLVVGAAAQQGAWVRANLRAGDVIVAVDGQRVRSLADIERVLTRAKARHRSSALFRVQRGRYGGSLNLPV